MPVRREGVHRRRTPPAGSGQRVGPPLQPEHVGERRRQGRDPRPGLLVGPRRRRHPQRPAAGQGEAVALGPAARPAARWRPARRRARRPSGRRSPGTPGGGSGRERPRPVLLPRPVLGDGACTAGRGHHSEAVPLIRKGPRPPVQGGSSRSRSDPRPRRRILRTLPSILSGPREGPTATWYGRILSILSLVRRAYGMHHQGGGVDDVHGARGLTALPLGPRPDLPPDVPALLEQLQHRL